MVLRTGLFHPLVVGRGCIGEFAPARSHGGYGIAPSPEVFSGEIAFLAAESCNRDSTLPFQEPHHRSDRVLRGNRDAHMDMVRHSMPFHNLALLLPGQRMKDLSQMTTHLYEEYSASPLGNEYHMVFAVPFGMG